METTNTLQDRLRELRKKLGLTQSDFAKKVGVTQAMLSSYEQGNVVPALDTLCNIANACDVSLDWLCGINEHQNNLDTYGDLFRMLVNVSSKTSVSVGTNNNDNFMIDSSNKPVSNSLVFRSSIIDWFLTEWANMISLLNEGRIDKELYEIWAENTAKKFDGYNLIDSWTMQEGKLYPF